MASSSVLTKALLKAANPNAEKIKFWKETRYLISQVEPTSNVTKQDWYKGRAVYPGPKADPRVGIPSNANDLEVLERLKDIRFVDGIKTDGADDGVGKAPFTIMTDAEADDYEATILALRKEGKVARDDSQKRATDREVSQLENRILDGNGDDNSLDFGDLEFEDYS